MKCSEGIRDVFERQLKYSDGIRTAFQLIIFSIEIGSGSYRGAFDLHSCTFETHSKHSLRIRNGLSILVFTRIYSECFECRRMSVRMLRMLLECSTNALRLPFDIFPLRMHFESFKHVKNIRTGPSNWPECTECTRNTIRMFRMYFDVDGMYLEFSFEVHSGSFRLPCD